MNYLGIAKNVKGRGVMPDRFLKTHKDINF